jgi:hypothetical protein
MPDIVQWKEISEKFTDGLILGNGASIALHSGFRYESLYDAAKELGHLSDTVAQVFKKFETTDFELVLRRLSQACLVNRALSLDSEVVEEAHRVVRQALISTVRDNHISYDKVVPHLPAAWAYMQRFKTVLSLNYDLIVYWALMASKVSIGPWFKDAFKNDSFRDDWETVREPYMTAKGSSLVFYPHGNLILARSSLGLEMKVAVGSGPNLLNSVLNKWNSGGVTPLFVSEGTSENKKHSIENTSYMHRVLREVIPKMGESLVIYGWSVSNQDQHIVQQLRHAGIQRVAISTHGDDSEFRRRVRQTFENIGVKNVVFFDSESPGCWPQAVKVTP